MVMKERVTHLNGVSFIVEIYGTEEQDTAYQGLATQTILVRRINSLFVVVFSWDSMTK